MQNRPKYSVPPSPPRRARGPGQNPHTAGPATRAAHGATPSSQPAFSASAPPHPGTSPANPNLLDRARGAFSGIRGALLRLEDAFHHNFVRPDDSHIPPEQRGWRSEDVKRSERKFVRQLALGTTSVLALSVGIGTCAVMTEPSQTPQHQFASVTMPTEAPYDQPLLDDQGNALIPYDPAAAGRTITSTRGASLLLPPGGSRAVVSPVPGYTVGRTPGAKFGRRLHPVHRRYMPHNGDDYNGPGIYGKPVVAMADGVVTTSEFHPTFGNQIVVDHGANLKTRYAHLSHKVPAGTKVKQGDRVGNVGSTGQSTGPHLHYELLYRGRAVNPRAYHYLLVRRQEAVSVCAPKPPGVADQRMLNRINAQYGAHINDAARAYNVPASLLTAIIGRESSGNPLALPDPSKPEHEQALGLMQLMPVAAKRCGLQVNPAAGVDDRKDPRSNIMGGACTLRSLSNAFNADISTRAGFGTVVGAYNVGIGNMQKGLKQAQAKRYVRKVQRFNRCR